MIIEHFSNSRPTLCNHLLVSLKHFLARIQFERVTVTLSLQIDRSVYFN